MGPAGNFGNDAPEPGVQFGLGRDHVRENAAVGGEHRRGRFVAGGFQGEEDHGGEYIPHNLGNRFRISASFSKSQSSPSGGGGGSSSSARSRRSKKSSL